MQNYQYPIDLQWSTEEMICVVEFWSCLEQAYETGIDRQKFLNQYKQFKTVVKSIGEERRLGKEFEELTGYSLYQTLKQSQQTDAKRLKMKG